MHGIVSLLDTYHSGKVIDIWKELSNNCEMIKAHVEQIPHFSWHIAEDYQWAQVSKELRLFVEEMPIFHVRTSGIGVFNGENPVVYIPIVRTGTLNRIHRKIWQLVENGHSNGSVLYSHENWMPHITLTFPEINSAKLNCVVDIMREHDLSWTIEIDNLSLISDPYEHPDGLRERFVFTK